MSFFLKFTPVLLIVAFALASFTCPLQGQVPDRQILEDIKEAYNQFHYDEVVSLCLRALAADPPPTLQDQVELYTHLAFASIALGKPEEAKVAFRSALDIDPDLILDPIYVSPKIIAIFDEIKTEKEREPGDLGIQPQELQLLSAIEKLEMCQGGAWRSLILPGWGQLYKGQKTKAIVHFTVQTLNVGTLLYAHFQMKQAHEDYLQAREPATIESKYDRYNSFYKLRNYCILSTAVVWLYSHIDAAVTSPKTEVRNQENGQIQRISPRLTSNSIGFMYTVQF
jgi:tetratricopeptide (TPR) repeat protein